MPLSQSTLANGIDAVGNCASEGQAAAALAAAYRAYVAGSSVSGVPAVGSQLGACELAMKAALEGMSLDGQGAMRLQAGIAAFWGAITPASALLIWPVVGATGIAVTPPGGLGFMAGYLVACFLANVTGGLEAADAASAVAAVVHGSSAGGLAMVTIPPGAAVSTPIL